MYRSVLVMTALLLLSSSIAEAAERRWIVTVDNGKPAGELVIRCAVDGDCSTRYIFKDNGRGPEISETFRIAADGTFANYEAKGSTTFGSRVDSDTRCAAAVGVGSRRPNGAARRRWRASCTCR